MGRDHIQDFYLLTDSQSSIDMSSNLVGAKKRSRHFRLRLHDIRQMLSDKVLKFKYVNTKHQLADFYSKLLPAPAYKSFRDQIMGLKDLTVEQTRAYCHEDKSTVEDMSKHHTNFVCALNGEAINACENGFENCSLRQSKSGVILDDSSLYLEHFDICCGIIDIVEDNVVSGTVNLLDGDGQL